MIDVCFDPTATVVVAQTVNTGPIPTGLSVAVAPLVAYFIMKWIFKTLGLGNPLGFKGALGMVSNIASNAASQGGGGGGSRLKSMLLGAMMGSNSRNPISRVGRKLFRRKGRGGSSPSGASGKSSPAEKKKPPAGKPDPQRRKADAGGGGEGGEAGAGEAPEFTPRFANARDEYKRKGRQWYRHDGRGIGKGGDEVDHWRAVDRSSVPRETLKEQGGTFDDLAVGIPDTLREGGQQLHDRLKPGWDAWDTRKARATKWGLAAGKELASGPGRLAKRALAPAGKVGGMGLAFAAPMIVGAGTALGPAYAAAALAYTGVKGAGKLRGITGHAGTLETAIANTDPDPGDPNDPNDPPPPPPLNDGGGGGAAGGLPSGNGGGGPPAPNGAGLPSGGEPPSGVGGAEAEPLPEGDDPYSPYGDGGVIGDFVFAAAAAANQPQSPSRPPRDPRTHADPSSPRRMKPTYQNRDTGAHAAGPSVASNAPPRSPAPVAPPPKAARQCVRTFFEYGVMVRCQYTTTNPTNDCGRHPPVGHPGTREAAGWKPPVSR